MATRYFLNFLIGLSLALGAMMLPADAEENNYIAVVGSGRAEQWPDYAEVTATVEALEKTTKDAVSTTTKMLLTLAKKLKDMGITDDRIEFLSPTVQRKSKQVRENEEWTEVTLGFESSQSLTVRVTDVNNTGTVITALTNAGAEIRSGAEFKVKDPNDMRARARANAIADARQKASDYAKGSNRRLGRLLIVEESQTTQYRLFPDLKKRITGSIEHRYRYGEGGPIPAPVPLTPQPVSTSVTLYVKFALQ